MKFYHFQINNIDPVSAYSKLHHVPYSLFLDSADTQHPSARYSFIVYDPIEVLEAKDGKVTIINRENSLSYNACPFETLKQRLDVYGMPLGKSQASDHLPPFRGGAAGFFGYDLARQIETLPNDTVDHDLPDMAVGLYNKVFAYDHDEKRGYFMVYANDEREALKKLKAFEGILSRPRKTQGSVTLSSGWTSTHTEQSYKEDVQKVIDYIYAGDIFQANLSQRFEAQCDTDFCPFSHYEFLRQINKSPFAAFMNFGSFQLSSTSPERFLKCTDKRKVETKPIKGTRPRFCDPVHNEQSLNDLRNSSKEHAENAMIVDLLRNDLSRVCADYSIDVSELCAIESFATVHHLVSTIIGELRADKTSLDLLKNAFPGGSITGAPKIRAMEVIEELEDKKRGPYCGSMGYIGFSGCMDTNIVIRTLIYSNNKVSLNVGGGLVADSDPAAEYQETLDKASAIFESFDNGQETYTREHQKDAA